MPEEKFSGEVGPITVDTGKGLNGSRMAEWPVLAMKESNISGAKGHAEFNSFDRKVRQGRDDKASS
jgi:hypothetical protein